MSDKKPQRRVSKQAVITLVTADNPKRTGSLAHARYALYDTGMTVEEYVAAGGRSGDIHYDVESGHITIA